MRSKNQKEAPILKADAARVAEQMQCKYVECSALTQEGLKNVFDEAMKTVLAKKIKPMQRKPEPKQETGCSLI